MQLSEAWGLYLTAHDHIVLHGRVPAELGWCPCDDDSRLAADSVSSTTEAGWMAQADEQHLDDYMRAADEEQKANEDAARKAGMEQEAWLSAQQDQMKADFDESIAEMAENQGLSSEGLLLSAMAFRREAQETAHTIGVEGLDADGVMYSRLQLLEETVQDVEAEAAAQGLSPQDYLHYGGIIDGVKADKADQLGMSEEAYVELAWDVVRSRARSTPVESA